MDTLPQSVKNIIHALEENKKEIENTSLLKIVKSAGITEKDFFSYAKFDHCKTESYGRNTLYQGKNFGIYIMSWAPGDFTGIHSHGHSEWGVVHFLGDADHRTYNVNGNKVELKSSEIIKKGTSAPVCGDLVHAMGNLSDKSFLTLHIYGSNSYSGVITEDSKLYEIEKDRIRTTLDPAFINISDELCKNEEQGIDTDQETRNDYSLLIEPFYKRNNKTI